MDNLLITLSESATSKLRAFQEEGGGFAFDNPNQPPLLRDPVAARVHQLIQEQINPGLASHGGRATLLDVRDGKVYLEFGGGCHGCGMVEVTLKRGVEATIKSEIPQITEDAGAVSPTGLAG